MSVNVLFSPRRVPPHDDAGLLSGSLGTVRPTFFNISGTLGCAKVCGELPD
jgi:hypothetical protein